MKCKTAGSLDRILDNDGIHFRCIEERDCKYKKVYVEVSSKTYCSRTDYLPYGTCIVDMHKYFDGYFHIKDSHGICSLHYEICKENKKLEKEMERRKK